MNFYKLASDRFSVRKFLGKTVEQEKIDRIIAAGHVAPTGCNFQPYRILVINNEEALEKLRGCTRCHFDAPLAMLVCFDKNECWTRSYDGAQSGIVDASIVATHLMLQAWELGVGSTWVMHFNPFVLREMFEIPENIEPVALLVMGYPADDAVPNEMHTIKRPVSDVVFFNRFK